MIQLVALNYILQNKDADLLLDYDIKYFSTYEREYQTIRSYYDEHGSIPDILTVIDLIPNFTVFEVTYSRESIMNKLYDEYVYLFTKNIMLKYRNDPDRDEKIFAELKTIEHRDPIPETKTSAFNKKRQ